MSLQKRTKDLFKNNLPYTEWHVRFLTGPLKYPDQVIKISKFMSLKTDYF